MRGFWPNSLKFPCIFPVIREFEAETVSLETASTAKQFLYPGPVKVCRGKCRVLKDMCASTAGADCNPLWNRGAI